MQEREHERLYFKGLCLVTAEHAIGLGVLAEGPVFISLNIRGNTMCDKCGVAYGPLVYQTGYVIEAHHVHSGSGGIYFGSIEKGLLPRSCVELGGWGAFIEPLRDESDDNRGWRPRRVIVTEIKAYCIGKEGKNPCAKELEDGFVVRRNNCLHPVCSLDDCGKYGEVVFNFRIRDRSVVFGNLR